MQLWVNFFNNLPLTARPMTNVKTNEEQKCWELHIFPTPVTSFPRVMRWKQKPIPIGKWHNSQQSLGIQEPLGLWPRNSWTPTVASLGIMWFCKEYGFLLWHAYCTMLFYKFWFLLSYLESWMLFHYRCSIHARYYQIDPDHEVFFKYFCCRLPHLKHVFEAGHTLDRQIVLNSG